MAILEKRKIIKRITTGSR